MKALVAMYVISYIFYRFTLCTSCVLSAFIKRILYCIVLYKDAQTVVRTTEGDSKAFTVKVGLHQGSVLSPLLFVIVMEMISREL